jgi:hypothetical protein
MAIKKKEKQNKSVEKNPLSVNKSAVVDCKNQMFFFQQTTHRQIVINLLGQIKKYV